MDEPLTTVPSLEECQRGTAHSIESLFMCPLHHRFSLLTNLRPAEMASEGADSSQEVVELERGHAYKFH